MARYDNNLQMWVADNGTYWGSQAEADTADSKGAASAADSDFFGEGLQAGSAAPAPGTGTSGDSAKTARTNELFSQGYTDINKDGYIDDADIALSKLPYGTPEVQGGTAVHYQVTTNPDGTVTAPHKVVPGDTVDIIKGKGNRPDVRVVAETPADFKTYMDGLGSVTSNGMVGGAQSLSYNAPSGGGPNGGADRTADKTAVDTAVDESKNNYDNKVSENEDENRSLWANAYENYNNIVNDTSLSDTSRAAQVEGMQLQRDLLKKLYAFDPKQYATQFSDEALARQVALARSGGTAAQQQAQTFAAMDQAPSLYAAGQREADSLQNQRLTQAENVVQNFGQLGTATRSQDENRSQFEATLKSSIADSVSKLTVNNVQLNDAESKAFADVWTNFAQLQSVYDKMSADEQIAWWEDQTKRYGIDKQFTAVLDQLRAGGAVTAKDLIGGLFQLGGSAIGAAGTIAAAGVKK